MPRSARHCFVDAALDLTAERNSLEFTLQDVVDRTGLSLHAFYQLFESKDALVEAVLEESLERGVAELRAARRHRDRSPRRGSARSSSATSSSRTESRQPMLRLRCRRSPSFAVHLDHARAVEGVGRVPAAPVLAYELLRAAVDDGAIRTDLDPDLLATFLLSSVRTVTEITMAGTATAARPSGEQLWQLVARGVAR